MKKSIDEILTFANPYNRKQTSEQRDYGKAWPSEEFFKLQHKKPKLVTGCYFVDLDGVTVTRANDSAGAKAVARELQKNNPESAIEIRYWEETEQEAENAYQERRARLWRNQIYKP